MSETEFQMPPKFSFDEFYEMLKEYVRNPKAREALESYDAEAAAGRGDLLNGGLCSDLAFDSFGTFESIGWSILVKHGWPTYPHMIQATKQDHEFRIKFVRAGGNFRNIARRLIRKEPDPWGWSFQDEDFDIDNRGSVLNLLKMWVEEYPANLPYELKEQQ